MQIAVNGDVRLPANAYAQIRQTSLLGEKFVSLSYPPDGEVADPTALAQASHAGYAYPHIGLGRTGATPEIEEVLGALSLLLNGGGLEQIKTITHELDQALSGHTADIRSLLSQTTQLTTSLNTQKARVLTAIDHLDTLAAHPEPAEAGAGRRAGHAAAGGPGAGRREEPVRHAADQPGHG